MWSNRSVCDPPLDYLLKIIVVGDSSVGKSCLLLRFTDKRFRSNHEVTIGVEFGSRVVEQQGVRFKVHVWDTAGQEMFRSITRSYYRTAAVALMVFDVTKRATFEHLQRWIEEVLNCAAPGVVLAVVANKTDLLEERQVSTEEGEAFASEMGSLYFETSAKEDVGIDDTFVAPCMLAIQRQSVTLNSAVHKITVDSIKTEQSCCHR